MAHDKRLKDAVRAKYVQGLSLSAAAAAHKASHATARNWKRSAKEKGDDWDIARAARRMGKGNLEELTAQVLEEMSTEMLTTIAAIKEDKQMAASTRMELLNKGADSYIKMLAAAGRAAPRLGALAVAVEVVQMFSGFVAERTPDKRTRLWLIDMVEEFGPVLSQKFSGAG